VTTHLRHFELKEFACKHCGQVKMDDGFLVLLDELRDRVGHPIVISSGYRCPEHNCAVSTTGPNGPHTTGHAADLAVRGYVAKTVLRVASILPFTGIGVNQKGTSRFIHLDNLPEIPGRPRPWVWSY